MASKKVAFMADKYLLPEVSKDVFAGQINGYHTIFEFQVGGGVIHIKLSASHPERESDPELDALLQSQKDSLVKKVFRNNRFVQVQIAAPISDEKLAERVERLYEDLTDYLRRNEYASGSFFSGADDGALSVINTNDGYFYLTEDEAKAIEESMRQQQMEEANKKERVFLGMIGATLGGLVGGALYFLIGILGYWAWISGVVGFGLAFFGYRKFAGKIALFGAMYSFFIGTIGIFLGIVGIWAWEIYQALKGMTPDLTFFYAFQRTIPLLMEEPDLKGKFIGDVLLWGGLSMVIGIFVVLGLYFDNKNKFQVKRM